MSNVLVDLHRLGGNKYNGLYHYCFQLGKNLAELTPADLNLFYYVPEKQINIFGGQYNYVKQKSIDKFFKIGTSKFDLWHVATTLSWYRPFNRKTKIIYTIHDLNFLQEEEYSAKSKKKYLALIQKRVNRAHYLTYISNFAKKQADENLNTGNKPYSVIYNGCNPANEVVLQEPLQKPGTPFLFSIGQFHTRKNFHVLPAILSGNDYKLVIAGLNDFDYKEKVMTEARKYGVESRIILPGAISENEKFWYYKNCLAFVFPSIGEGFGLPVVEAMQFGKPVFLSNQTSLPEVGGDAAYYFENFDPELMRITFEKGMNDYNNNKRSVSIQQQASLFDWKKITLEYLDVYRKLVSI